MWAEQVATSGLYYSYSPRFVLTAVEVCFGIPFKIRVATDPTFFRGQRLRVDLIFHHCGRPRKML